MSISTIYHVEVEIPGEFWYEHRENQRYQRASIAACEGYIEAGTDHYDRVFEWATFNDRAEAERCERELLKIAAGDLSAGDLS